MKDLTIFIDSALIIAVLSLAFWGGAKANVQEQHTKSISALEVTVLAEKNESIEFQKRVIEDLSWIKERLRNYPKD